MKVSTTIANNIHIADDKARYDAACRRLLSDKMILAWIMKNCLEEFRDCGIKEIADQYIEGKPSVADVPVHPDEEALSGAPMISSMENEDVTITEGTITSDIRFQAMVPSSGEQIRLISIEMTHSLESEVSLMCNLSEGVERRGIEKGLIKGIEQGLEKGMEQGKIYGLIEAYRDDNLPEAEIIARLQKKFGLTESEIRKYLD